MNFKGTAKRLDDIDIPLAGARIGVGEDEVHAFMDVEAAGSGFDSLGRPKALFEPHIFYRLLSGEQRSRAVLMGLAYENWGEKPYPRDSYPRIAAATQINPEAALKATSWGLGQIMGLNHEVVGYHTVFDMVEAFKGDEEAHLNAIIDFLMASGIDDDLRNHDWAAVARVYNGPGYAKHAYNTRMAQRFAWWQKIPDTPFAGKKEPLVIEAGAKRGSKSWAVRSIKKLREPASAMSACALPINSRCFSDQTGTS
jgi:hypothetical protein